MSENFNKSSPGRTNDGRRRSVSLSIREGCHVDKRTGDEEFTVLQSNRIALYIKLLKNGTFDDKISMEDRDEVCVAEALKRWRLDDLGLSVPTSKPRSFSSPDLFGQFSIEHDSPIHPSGPKKRIEFKIEIHLSNRSSVSPSNSSGMSGLLGKYLPKTATVLQSLGQIQHLNFEFYDGIPKSSGPFGVHSEHVFPEDAQKNTSSAAESSEPLSQSAYSEESKPSSGLFDVSEPELISHELALTAPAFSGAASDWNDLPKGFLTSSGTDAPSDPTIPLVNPSRTSSRSPSLPSYLSRSFKDRIKIFGETGSYKLLKAPSANSPGPTSAKPSPSWMKSNSKLQ